VHDLVPFAVILLLAAVALLAAVGSNRLAERVQVPAPALFLIAAAIASDLAPKLGGLTIVVDQRIVTVALVVILFDGGMHIGWGRMRTAAGAVVWLGVAGTAVTAGGMALGAHYLFGFDWRAGLLLGAALAPTDPAVVFSVLGRREISGRTGTLLEGESGANDPVGIALMVSLLGAGGGGWSAVGSGVGHFALQLAVGAAFGVVGGWLLLQVMRRVPLPNEALYPVQTVAFALLLYGGATALEGSGFLAVFLAGILVGDARAPYKREIERFAGALAGLAEIVAFVVLGLSVHLSSVFHGDRVWTGLGLAGLLILFVRPLLVGALLLPIRLRPGERLFVALAGLKGAVPILLGTYVLVQGARHAGEIYDVVFEVVLVSVLVQGGLVPSLARWLRVPMRVVEPEPWALGMRFRDEPRGLRRYVVARGSPADGCSVRDLDVGEDFWISMVSRDGQLVQVRGATVLRSGDEVLALTDEDDAPGAVFG
jgi:NhaP-type Na+/H+ and K+/H+ antiporters with a unique C-terminal domain